MRKLVLLLALLSATSLRAQTVFDNKTLPANHNASSLTFSHTTSSSANRVMIFYHHGSNSLVSVSTVTYGGTSMTLLNATNNGSNSRMEAWCLLNPATGANNVVSTLSGTDTGFSEGVLTFTNANNCSNTAVGTASSTTTVTVTVTSAVGDLVVDGACSSSSDFKSAGSVPGQTQRYLDNTSNVDSVASTNPGAASVSPSEPLVTEGGNRVIIGVDIVSAGSTASPIMPPTVYGVLLAMFLWRAILI